ncbi:MAG: hypothetical protein U0Q18_24315 [Bryobacteraceae bacterium]
MIRYNGQRWSSIPVFVFAGGMGVLSVLPASAQGVWSKPVNVSSTQPDNYGTAVAIDAAGNAVAASVGLVQTGTTVTNIYATSAPAGGAWAKPVPISSTGRAGLPVMRMDGAGNASSAWTSFLDTQIAERAAGGSWQQAQTVAPVVLDAQFLVNARGDQALVWTTSAPLGLDVSVMRKAAGGTWGPAQIVASGNAATIFVLAGRAALGDGGDLMVPFEYFRLYCPPPGGCLNIGWTQKTARQAQGAVTWEISGTQAGPDTSSHNAVAAVSAAGAAGVVYRKASALYATTQTGPGQAWNAPVALYTATKLSNFGVGGGSTGSVTLFALDSGAVVAADGDLATGLWSPSVVISGTDNSATRMSFAVASGGAAVAAWNGPATGSKNPIRAAVRPAGVAVWNAPVSATPLFPGATPDSAGINAAGQAVLGLTVYKTSYSRASLVATYAP